MAVFPFCWHINVDTEYVLQLLNSMKELISPISIFAIKSAFLDLGYVDIDLIFNKLSYFLFNNIFNAAWQCYSFCIPIFGGLLIISYNTVNVIIIKQVLPWILWLLLFFFVIFVNEGLRCPWWYLQLVMFFNFCFMFSIIPYRVMEGNKFCLHYY